MTRTASHCRALRRISFAPNGGSSADEPSGLESVRLSAIELVISSPVRHFLSRHPLAIKICLPLSSESKSLRDLGGRGVRSKLKIDECPAARRAEAEIERHADGQ